MRRLGISAIASERLCERLTASFCAALWKWMKPTLAEESGEWVAATKGTRLLLLEQSNAPERFDCKLSRTLTRRPCISLFMTTRHRTQKRSTRTKCPPIGELKMQIRNIDGLTTLRKNGLLGTFIL